MLFNLSPDQIYERFKDVSTIVAEEYILKLDMSLFEARTPFLAKFRDVNIDIKEIIHIDSPGQLILTNALREFYTNKLMDTKKNTYRFINPSNFVFNIDNTKVASKDFRVMIHDHTTKQIPYQVKLHLCTIASGMLTGVINYNEGYLRLEYIMSEYGILRFMYTQNGIFHIEVHSNSPKYQDTGQLSVGSS